ncbi:MAG: Transcription termination protein NusB [Myxococcaceae bacterium]|nr:Transcription termination protein NusB [Myxococcaceae bacterium]
MGARTRGREAALQILFAEDLAGGSLALNERLHWAHLAASVEGKDFASAVVEGYGAHAEEIDTVIRKVSEHWRLERMPLVDRNILRLATYEILYMPDVPRRVTLNEAVELAKRYGGENSAGFVNGVLDRIATEAQKA